MTENPSDQDLLDLWQKLAGPRPGLWTLSRYSRTELRTRPTTVVYDNIKNTLGSDASAADVLNSIAGKDALGLLAICANVNSRLMEAGASNSEFHSRLENDLSTADLRAALHEARRDRRSDLSVIFTRRNLLLTAKLVLGLHLSGDDEFDQRQFGMLALRLNDFLERPNRTRALTDEEIAIDSLTSWTLHNSADLWMDIARADLIMEEFFTSDDEQIRSSRARLELSQEPFDGMPLMKYRRLVFLTYHLMRTAVEKGEAPILSIEAPLPEYVGGTKGVNEFLSRRSIPIDGFEDPVFGSAWSQERFSHLLMTPSFLNDLRWLRQKPFIKLGDNRYLLLDLRIAVERMTSGLYWTIFDSLQSADRLLFSSAWGRAYERYVQCLLEAFYPQQSFLSKQLQTNVPFSRPAGGGEIDALLDFGSYVLVIEVKSASLPLDVRDARDRAIFDRWVAERLMKGSATKRGAFVQLSEGCMAVVDGLLPGEVPEKIFPVLVSDEAAFASFGVNRMLHVKFQDNFPSGLPSPIRPLTILTTSELEEILPCVAGESSLSWDQLLQQRFHGVEVGWLSAGQALYNFYLESGKTDERRLNFVLLERYNKFIDELRAQLPHSGEEDDMTNE